MLLSLSNETQPEEITLHVCAYVSLRETETLFGLLHISDIVRLQGIWLLLCVPCDLQHEQDRAEIIPDDARKTGPPSRRPTWA